mmetsp:Transcript_7992/g.17354  ORF Transcript_7992/g.17354 Transcript_7992/m.17354 type:complete len:310 (-) Transcript_7992:345-1274(-)
MLQPSRQQRQPQQIRVLLEQAEVEKEGEEAEVEHLVVALEGLSSGGIEDVPEDFLEVVVLVDPIGHHQLEMLAGRTAGGSRGRVAQRAGYGQVELSPGGAVGRVISSPARGVLEGSVMVPSLMIGREEDLLGGEGEEGAHVLAAEGHVAEIRVAPVGLHHVEEMHEGVVLGVGMALANAQVEHVGLVHLSGPVVPGIEAAEGLAGHVVDALFLEFVLHAAHVALHEIRGVEDGLGHVVDVFFLRIAVGEAEADVGLEEPDAEEVVEEGLVQLGGLHDGLGLQYLFVILAAARGEVDAVEEVGVDGVDQL